MQSVEIIILKELRENFKVL